MNHQKMCQVIERIENLPPERFDMGSYFASINDAPFDSNYTAKNECNTSACIAGHTAIMFSGKQTIEWNKAHAIAKKELELTMLQAGVLFEWFQDNDDIGFKLFKLVANKQFEEADNLIIQNEDVIYGTYSFEQLPENFWAETPAH